VNTHLLSIALFTFVVLAGTSEVARAGQLPSPVTPPSSDITPADQQGTPPSGAPLRLTLQDALERARKNSTVFQAAVTDAGLAREDRTQARDALLPSVLYNNQVIYSQSNQAGSIRFIANNAVHEYLSQGNVHEVFDFTSFNNFRRLSVIAAVARAKADVASRGLVVTVVQKYYAVAAAQQKLETARRNSEEGDGFLKLTQELENGGEVAHSDVIKAELQMQERRRQFQEAQLGLINTRLDLAVIIFPDFNNNFDVADDLHSTVPLPPLAAVQQQAGHNNPDLRVALETVKAEDRDVAAARSGYLPSLTLDYFYGIDATRFSTYTVTPAGRVPNLGSAATATLLIPIWNWGSTQSRVKQAGLRRVQAKRELSFAQRRLLAQIQTFYAEADAALNELAGLSRSAQLAAESLRLITLRYRDGESTVLEVVDAQTTFALANNAYQDGAVRYRVALANLQTLTGVLTTP